jgi:tetratricopeptide (TPR) repeat protein
MKVENNRFVWKHDKLIVRLYCEPRIALQKPVTDTSLDEIGFNVSKVFTGQVGASIGVVSFTSGTEKSMDISRPALEWSSHQTPNNQFYYRLSIPMSIMQTSENDISLISLRWKDVEDSHKLQSLRAEVGYEDKDFKYEFSKVWTRDIVTNAPALSLNFVQRPDVLAHLLYHALEIFPEDLWIPEYVVFRLWKAYAPTITDSDCKDIASDLNHLVLIERRPDDGVMRLHHALHDFNRKRLEEQDQYKLAHEMLLDSYGVTDWLQLPRDDLYIWQYLAYHLIEANRADELHTLLTASPDWMNAKERIFYSDSAYVADLELAMKAYNDPLEPDEISRLIELTTARQVVNARIGVYTYRMLVALVHLGREQEAINHARLRTDMYERFRGLFAIWQISDSERVTVSELMQVADVKWAYRPPYALSELGVALARADDARADECFTKAHENIASLVNTREINNQDLGRTVLGELLVEAGRFDEASDMADSIGDYDSKDFIMTKLASSLAHAGRIDEARKVVDSIPLAHKQIDALSQIATALAKANDSRADEAFQNVREAIDSIEYSRYRDSALSDLAAALAQAQRFDEAYEVAQTVQDQDSFSKAFALHTLANALTQAQRFDEAYEVAQTIQNTYWKTKALSQLTNTLIQAQRFDKARDVANTIQDASAQVVALSELATALVRANDSRADAIFKQAREVADTIQNASRKADALSELVIALAQADDPRADETFNYTREVAYTIRDSFSTDDYDKTVALRQLGVALAQTDDTRADETFNYARELADSIPDILGSTRKALALRQLANLHALAQRFDEAREIADSIEDASQKAAAIRELASAFARAGDPRADETFNQAHEMAITAQYESRNADSLRQLVIALTQVQRFDETREVINSIKYGLDQTHALSQLATALARVQRFDEALEIADTIQDTARKANTLCKVATALARVDDPRADETFNHTRGIAKSIQDSYFRVNVLRELATALIQVQRFDEALEIVDAIPDADTQVVVLNELAIVLAGVNDTRSDEIFNRAREVADTMQHEASKTDALSKIAIALAQAHRYEQAQALADSSQYDTIKTDILSHLAASLIEAHRFEQAKAVALTIPEDSTKVNILKQLAIALAQNKRLKDAVTIPDVWDINTYIKFLSECQTMLIDLHPNESKLWQRVMLGSLEIICWVRKDYEPVRDILRKQQ